MIFCIFVLMRKIIIIDEEYLSGRNKKSPAFQPGF